MDLLGIVGGRVMDRWCVGSNRVRVKWTEIEGTWINFLGCLE